MEVVESSVDLLREFERTGRPEPFETFMRRHASMVYATCLKVTRDPHDAEDATQATFLTLASKSRLNGEIRQPEAWLRKVAHRLALDLIRSKKRRVNRENLRSEMHDEATPLNSHDNAHKGEVKGILNEELAKLPASYRMPLILHYFGGLSRDEMAAQLNLKPSTLGVRLHRAREQLRRKLAARGILLPTIALTALLTEVVRGSVCGHLMSSTARQASSIVLGHAGGSMVAAPMFAAGTGVDSIGSLLSMLSHGKLKLLLSLAILGSAISMSSAQVRMLLPEAIRSWLPVWRVPSITIPRIDLTLPRPAFAASSQSSAESKIQKVFSLRTVPTVPGATMRASISSLAFAGAELANVTSNVTRARTLKAPQPAASSADVATPQRAIQPNWFAQAYSSPTRVPVTAASTSMETSTIAARATSVPRDEERHWQHSSTAATDAWNSVIAPASNDGGPASASAGGGGGGGAPPARLFDRLPIPAPVPQNIPSRLTAPVTGGVPALLSDSGTQAGTVDDSSASKAAAHALTKPSAHARPQAAAAMPSVTTTRTLVFNGISANVGGYSDQSLKPTQLNHLSLDELTARTRSTPPGYSFNYPAVPGSTLSVNGARVTLHNKAGVDQTSPATIKFVDTSTTAIPKLPDGHTFIGVWQLDVDTSFTSLDLLVRYDDLRAARLGLNERILKLWVSDGNGWSLLWRDPTFGRDVNQNMMWVTARGGVKFFAASAPEPATLATAVAALSLYARRRRR